MSATHARAPSSQTFDMAWNAQVEFDTQRLRVCDWHSDQGNESTLVDVVRLMLTPAVTASLPPSWQGFYDRGRAQAWIAERDKESTVLLVTDRSSEEPVGLVIVFEEHAADDPALADLRLGYLLAERAWGYGFATELVGGLVQWCGTHSSIRSIVAGVALGNDASARVLTKNGFTPTGDPSHGEQLYTISRRPRTAV